jgi:hypothetical protein
MKEFYPSTGNFLDGTFVGKQKKKPSARFLSGAMAKNSMHEKWLCWKF